MTTDLTVIKWTQFWDMHSGGGLKEEWSQIYIEAPEAEAKVIFYNRFGHNPDRVSCTCCGSDYSISEYDTLAEATAFHRNAVVKNGIEYRDKSLDSYALRYAKKMPDERIQKLYRLAVDKSTTDGERENAMVKLLQTPNPHMWSYRPLITMEEFLENFILRDGPALVIWAKDIKPQERDGTLPQQGYVWLG